MTAESRIHDKTRVCGRCGIRHLPNNRTPGKDYCSDCRPDAALLGWYEQPAYGEGRNAA